MALTFGSSSPYSSYARHPTRVPAPTVAAAVKKHVTFTAAAEVLPPAVAATVQFHIPYTTIDLFFRPEMMIPLAYPDTPPIYLVIDDVPAVALPDIRLYIEKINEHAKIDHSPTTKRLIVSCASHEHNYMAYIGPEIMRLITSDDNSFTGNDPVFEIVENTDSEIRLGDEKRGRQPDGGLRLLNSDSRLPPFLVWEVVDSQPLSSMIEKITHYFTKSDGLIRIVIVIQLIRQRPPKRKRRASSIGDGSDTGASSRVTEDIGEGEPVPPQPPPRGRLVEGFYWVYKHACDPAGDRVILCPIEHEEFYPTPPSSVLTLTWADIMYQVPPQLASKTVTIPFMILHERFRKLVDMASGPPLINDPKPQQLGKWNITDFPGIVATPDRSDPPSTSEASNEGADPSFEGVAEAVPDEGAGPRRSARLARGVRRGRRSG
ncbi:hypothetical protein Q9L58_007646 [Maublancomyces gigas]|uniref:Uncharacterized protein n=1 Tax=Discina gigas TaxID=1032678 RepID=A0ABR3GD33_9PEZI